MKAFLTAPWEPFVERRGDALGLRALADTFADAVAPDMSSRIVDARWITILSWCLVQSHETFRASGGTTTYSRADQRERYEWLKPLELMWIARTILCADNWSKRQLPGRRGVARWCNGSRAKAQTLGLSEEQYGRYRDGGPYGAYRRAFRKWPGLTDAGNGWTPGLHAKVKQILTS